MENNKKTVIIILSAIIIIGIGLAAFYTLRPKQITPLASLVTSPISDNSNKPDVIISTDKTEYDKGEIIKISVNNKLDTSILYSTGGDKFWGIEYFKDGNWINSAYAEGGSFQLTEKNIGNTCDIALYERMTPTELKSEADLSSQWNQKICPFRSASPTEPRIIRYIGSGQYRFTFAYGFEISKDDPFRLSDFKIIYSNSFTIR